MFRRVPLPFPKVFPLVLLLSMGGAVGCGSDEPSASSAAKIESFQVAPEQLEGPGEVGVSWRTTGASSLRLLLNDGEIELGDAPIAEGIVHVLVEESASFRLIAADSKGRVIDARASVLVEDDGRPLIGSFEAPAFVEADAQGIGRFIASWERLRRADTLSLEVEGQEPRSLEAAVEGSVEVEIEGDATLSLRAANEAGETTASLDVRLVEVPIIESFVADRLRVGTGEDVTLSWTTSGASAVSLWINRLKIEGLDPAETTGSITVPIFLESEVELRAEEEHGVFGSKTIEITVGSPTIEEAELDVSSLWLGETMAASWLTSGGSRLILSNVETKEVLCEVTKIDEINEGSCPWTPPEVGIHSLELVVTNSSGAASAPFELVVGTGPLIARFGAAPAQLNVGEETVISWWVLPDPAGNVPALALRDDLDNTYGVVGAEGMIDVSVLEVGTRTFTLEATTNDSRSTPSIATAAVDVLALPIISARANPEHFDDADAARVVVSWTTEHAEALSLERRATAAAGGPADEIVHILGGDVAAGNWSFIPTVDTTLRLIGTNAIGGTSEQEVVVTVAPTDILSFDAQPRALTQGQPVTLSWRTQMSDRVEIDAPGFGATYLVEEHAQPYLDIASLGGSRLTLRACGGTVITDGCGVLEFPPDFRFPFAGALREEIFVHTKGVASFDLGMAGAVGDNEPLPTKKLSSWIQLVPYWDELAWNPERYPQGNIFWSMIEDEKGRGLAIQWKDAGLWSRAGSITGFLDVSISFETVLREDGSFEYRYGRFFKRTNELPSIRQRFFNSTIGFQLLESDAHQLAYAETVPLLGLVAERSFSYRPLPELGKEGELVWYPLGTAENIDLTLSASRGASRKSQSIALAMERKPLVEISPEVIAPALKDEDFFFLWKSFNATSLWVEDGEGVERCRATLASLEEGVCSLRESSAGVHRYTVKAEGAHGFITERIVEVTVYGDFGVFEFVANQPSVEKGAGVTLSWTAFNVEQLMLFRDGVEILSEAESVGSHHADNIHGETEFILRAVGGGGVVDEAQLTVSNWDVLIDLQADRTITRPGEPVTVSVDVKTADGSEPAELFGFLPLVEITDPTHRFMPLVGATGVASPQEIELPFPFPYMGREYTTATVNMHGYLSFNPAAATRPSNTMLPSAGNPSVELAPFWTRIALHGDGNVLVGEQGGAFVIEWSKASISRASSAASPNNLNFQIVLFPDGAFEYRYGTMDPVGTNNNCRPSPDCRNEAMGSVATIGYSYDSGKAGYTFHFGGTEIAEENPVVPGGLTNRTFRYPRQKGSQTFTFHPRQTEDFHFCALSGGEEVCKLLSIQAEFGLDKVTVSPSKIAPGGEATIAWESRGGLRLEIHNGEEVIYETADIAIIDSGTYSVKPAKDSVYTISIVGGPRYEAAVRTVEVETHQLIAQLGQSTGPGQPVNLSWSLSSAGSGSAPALLTPMEEIEADYYELDLSSDPNAELVISATNEFRSSVNLQFKGGFTFPYFGQELRSIYVAVGGYLTMKSGNSTNNAVIPASTHAGKLLMPFWDQLNTMSAGKVYAKALGTDRYVIQWTKMSLHYAPSDDASLNFMVVLHRDGSFEYRYGTMEAPAQEQTNPSACFPSSCLLESNGSSATIAYMDPTATIAQIVHFGGINRAEGQQPVARGLSGRAWKFTPRTGSGSMTVYPSETRTYQVCAFDSSNELFVCPPLMEVDVPWGIDFFTAPEGPLAGEEFNLSWKVTGLDSLRIMEGGQEIASYSGGGIPLMGSQRVSVVRPTTFTLVAESMSRTKAAALTVSPRLFDLVVNGPGRPLTPGEKFVVDWELTELTDEPIQIITPLTEIDASPGADGAYSDVQSLEGAQELSFQDARGQKSANGVASVELPFTFRYLGAERTKVGVHRYGYLTFTELPGEGTGENKPFPTEGRDEDRVHLAPFWDSLVDHGIGKVHAYAPDPQTMIIQWSRYSHSAGSGITNPYDLNFQVVLHADGTFKYRYGRMRGPEQPFFHTACINGHCREEANGASATIGYQDVAASRGSTLHLSSIAIGGNEETIDDPVPDRYLAFPGGLEGRSFAYQPAMRGSSTITAGQSGTYEVCGFHAAYSACKSVEVETKADGGDLGITELMIDPAGGARGQWFEVRNYSRRILDLNGFEIVSIGGAHRVEGTLLIEPGEFKTLAASSQVGFSPDYVYGTGAPLDRHLDRLELWIGDALIASVKWNLEWTIPRNESLTLEGAYQEAGVQERASFSEWCSGGPVGSPGQLGPSCLSSSYRVDAVSNRPFMDISQTGTRFHDLEASRQLERLPITGPPVEVGGQPYNHIWVFSSGYISFSDVRPTPLASVGAPYEFPRPVGSNNPLGPIISALWGDLLCDRQQHDCRFFYERIDADGHSVLVLQWDGYRFNWTTGGSITFQIQLWEDGDVVVAYGEVDNPFGAFTPNWLSYMGSSGWIGVEVSNHDWSTAHFKRAMGLAHRSFWFSPR